MRILIVGAGATGGYFGGRLAQAGRDVTFLVRPGRAAQIRENGLVLISPHHGDATLHPTLILANEITQPFDAVILAVKAYALENTLADMRPAIGPNTMIVPLLNGMRHIDRLTAAFGETPVLGGVCVVATTIDAQNRIVQLAPFHELTYGERNGPATPRIHALHEALSGAGFDSKTSTTILQDMWEKWMLLASAGALTCLLRGTVGEIEAVPNGAALALKFLKEVTDIATASGFPPRDPFLQRARTTLTTKGSPFATSMYRDLQAGAPVEVEQIIADLLPRAAGFGIDTPRLEAAVAQLRIYNTRR
jgi:2-dehydropantoate 2-reductase